MVVGGWGLRYVMVGGGFRKKERKVEEEITIRMEVPNAQIAS